jgi:UDP-N-acetylglucosamine 4-epimerase
VYKYLASCFNKFNNNPIDTLSQDIRNRIRNTPVLLTGGAGFIGSHIAARLMALGVKKLTVLDNLSSGKREYIEPFMDQSGFRFIEGDLTDLDVCMDACKGQEVICHQAAVGSTIRSVESPHISTRNNVDGFVNLSLAARECAISTFVYASSCAVYGESEGILKQESQTGKQTSPYAVTKLANELFAGVFADLYGIRFTGLRYFNVFGPRQDPEGDYAAVIPRFLIRLMEGKDCTIFGDGEQTRDFVHVADVVQANILAMFTRPERLEGARLYNVGSGERVTVNELYEALCRVSAIKDRPPLYGAERAGDILHIGADLSRVKTELGYIPQCRLEEGLKETLESFSSGETA